jgi:hypothetical protein
MAILGIILIVAALAAVVFGFLQHRAAKKLLAAPFHKTGQVAADPSLADAKGLISFEGDVQPLQQLVAPVSGRPCLYFEVEVERLWKKWEVTENGSSERSGKSNVRKDHAGSVFAVNDGSGPMQVDAREGVKVDDKDMVQSFEQTINMSSGNGSVGQYNFHVPASMSSDEHTYGVRVVERVVDAQGHMFVAGKHNGQMVSKADGMMGSLQLSKRGRDALIGGQKKKATIGFVLAGVSGLAGIPTTVFGDMPSGGSSSSCAAVFEAGQATSAEGCTNKVSTKAGDSYTWNVQSDADYSIEVDAPKGVKFPIAPILTVTDASGQVLTDAHTGSFEGHLAKGTYKVVIQDADLAEGRAKQFKGGFSYIAKITVATAPSVSSALMAKVEPPTPAIWSCHLVAKTLCNEHALPATKAEKTACVNTGGKYLEGSCPEAGQLGQCYHVGDVRFTSYKGKATPTLEAAEAACEAKGATFFPADAE